MSTSLPTQQNLASLRTIENDPRYGFCQADICDRKTMSALVHESRPDAVLHLAVESHVDHSIDGPAEFIKTNVEGGGGACLLAAAFGPAGQSISVSS